MRPSLRGAVVAAAEVALAAAVTGGAILSTVTTPTVVTQQTVDAAYIAAHPGFNPAVDCVNPALAVAFPDAGCVVAVANPTPCDLFRGTRTLQAAEVWWPACRATLHGPGLPGATGT